VTDLHYLDPRPMNKPAVVLLHGLGMDGSSWALQQEPLIAAGFRPVCPDAPGFGASPYDGHGWSIRRAAQAVAELVRQLGVAPAHVVGISMGGVIALQLALDHPHLVRRLVLTNTFARIRPDTLSGWMYFARRAILVHTVGIPTQARLVAKHLFPGPDQGPIQEELIRQVSRADPRAYRAALRALGLYNSTRRLGEIKVPTLVITGDRDTTVPPRNQRALAEQIANSRQIILSGAGHAASVERAEEFNRAMLDFLTEAVESSTQESRQRKSG
jgi:3-oxoadipate enol-lactonase